MTCPVCGEPTRVKDVIKESDQVLRARMCRACGRVFYTVETEAATASADFTRAYDERSRRRYWEERKKRKEAKP